MARRGGATFYLVRHGESEANIKQIWQGQRVDSPLTIEGKRQAAALGRRFLDANLLEVKRIYSSPSKRAHETALILQRYLAINNPNLGLRVTPAFLEIDHGDLSGLNRRQIQKRYSGFLEKWYKDPASLRFPMGENLTDVSKRTWAQIALIKRHIGNGKVVIVTHAEVIKGICLSLLGAFHAERFIRIPNCGLVILRIRDDGRKIIYFGDPEDETLN